MHYPGLGDREEDVAHDLARATLGGSHRTTWAWWTVAGMVGGTLASLWDTALTWFVTYALLMLPSPALPSPVPLAGLLIAGLGGASGAIGGTIVGVSQWLVLRRRIADKGGWILACGAGFALAGAIRWTVVLNLPRIVQQFGLTLGAATTLATVASVSAAVLAGVGQWLVLRRVVRRAGWWVPAYAAAALVGHRVSGAAAGALVDRLFSRPTAVVRADPGQYLGQLVAWDLGAIPGLAVHSALTGLALLWLLRYPRRAPEHAPAAARGLGATGT